MDTNANDVITSNKIVEPKKIYYSYCKVQKVLYGFMETDVMCVRVVGLNSYKNLRSAYGSYYSCAKKSKLPIRVSTRKVSCSCLELIRKLKSNSSICRIIDWW